jgi:hypothetical protein
MVFCWFNVVLSLVFWFSRKPAGTIGITTSNQKTTEPKGEGYRFKIADTVPPHHTQEKLKNERAK